MSRLLLAFRSLRRTPLLWAGISLTLTLALGAAALVFTLLNNYLFRPLPYGDASRIAVIYEYPEQSGRAQNLRVSFGTGVDIMEQAKSFSRVGLLRNESFTYHGPTATEVAFTQRVTVDFFPILGVRAALGDIIHAGNADLDGQRALLLSDSLWRRLFGADPAVIGRSVRLDDRTYRVVGVMPAGFVIPTGDDNPQGWTAMVPADYMRNERVQRRHHLIGELAPGATLSSAERELSLINAAHKRDFPAHYANFSLMIRSLREDLVGNFNRPLVLLQGAVVLVLLVACLNCLCLLFARSVGRRREFAVRLALGASPLTLARQLFAESFLLALPAIAAAGFIAWLAAPHLTALLPAVSSLRAIPDPRPDALVLIGLALTGLGITTLFSLLPLRQALSLNLESALRDGGRQIGSVSGGRALRWLVAGQITVTLALLVGATLLLRTQREIQKADYGMPLAELDYFRVGVRGQIFSDPAARMRVFRQIAENVSRLPGVVGDVSYGTTFFAPSPIAFSAFQLEGDTAPITESTKRASLRSITPNYGEVTALRIVEGRWFSAADDATRPDVAVISQSLARKCWPGASPLGKRIRVDNTNRWIEVVGVARDILDLGNQPKPYDIIYLPVEQRPPLGLGVGFLYRYKGAPPDQRALQQAIHAADPNAQGFAFGRVDALYRDSTWQTRFVLVLVAAFAALAIILAVGGLYAVISFLVATRTSEFGVRLALGASPGDVARLVLREGLRLTLLGVAVGVVLAAIGSRALSGLIYNLPAVDLVSYLGSALLLAAACALASWLPAKRAAKVDPVEALRAN
jgi:predicted permease